MSTDLSLKPLRLGVTGGPGVGKTTFVTALAARLGLPVIAEEMRSHLMSEGPIAGRSAAEISTILADMRSSRERRERELGSFVADNVRHDFDAYALHHGAASSENEQDAGARAPEPRPYDAIFLLPWGVVPYEPDGVRPGEPSVAFRHHLLIEGLLRRSVFNDLVHEPPAERIAVPDRVEWAIATLASRGLVASTDRHDRASTSGFVYLIGAGPGDLELLTIRAARLLGEVDVVAYDDLVPDAVVKAVAPRAEHIRVGHRGRGAADAPYRIHPVVLERARGGARVARLKCGDPAVFARGGEEVEELEAAGIPFQIVPGVTAAFAAAAALGTALTHRDAASDLTFVTAHDLVSGRPSRTNWAALGQGTGTIVIYMGARRLAANLARLVEHGRDPATPAFYIERAGQSGQRVVAGTLADLASRCDDADPTAPAVVIVGKAARVATRAIAGSDEAGPRSGGRASAAPIAIDPTVANAFPPPWRRGVYEAIARRRDVRSFRSDPIPRATLARILGAAHRAGSVGFSQPWDFVVVEDRALRERIRGHVESERLRAAAAFEGERRERYLSLKIEGILEAPINVCVTCDRERFGPAVLGRFTMPSTDVMSTCCAIQNLWLAARAEGVGVGWVSILEPAVLRELLAIPESVEPIAYLCLGFVDAFAAKPTLETSGWLPRMALESVLHHDRWGGAADTALIEAIQSETAAIKEGAITW